MNLDVRSVCDVWAREDRDRPPEAELLREVVEVELSMLQAEVAERACRLQATLNEALNTGRLFCAVVYVSLSRKLFLHSRLLLLLVNREGLAQVYLL